MSERASENKQAGSEYEIYKNNFSQHEIIFIISRRKTFFLLFSLALSFS
jgi:hypothetical protein